MTSATKERPGPVDAGLNETVRPGEAAAAPEVPPELRPVLLDIARAALDVATGLASGWALAERIRRATALAPELRAAVFVTLTDDGVLRACMGTLDPGQPVAQAVAAAAMTAALDDPRFYPVEANELAELHVDISILGRPVELPDVQAFAPGVDGVIVERGMRLAMLLPEVATRQRWDAARMLRAACEKAGLPGDAWRDPATRRSVFRTVRFGGPVAVETPPT